MSISIRKLIQKPGSPDIALEQATIAESALARIAHVNRLPKDVYDIVYHTLDLSDTDTLRVKSKRGIVEVSGAEDGNATIFLRNREILEDPTKFYFQFSVKSPSPSIVVAQHRALVNDTAEIELMLVGGEWASPLILYYEMIKIE